MPMIAFFLPIIIAYIFFIPSILRHGTACLRSWKPHTAAVSCAVFTLAVLILCFMDFGAFLSFSAAKLFVVVLSALAFMSALFLACRFVSKGNLILLVVISLLVSLFAEVTVINFKYWQSREYQKTVLTDTAVLSGLYATENEGEYSISGSCSISLEDLDVKVNNIFLDAYAKNDKENTVYIFSTVRYTDESNANFASTPKQTLFPTASTSRWLELHTNGVSEDIKINLSTDGGKLITINEIAINSPHPFVFNVARAAVIALVIFLAVLLRPKSRVWSYVFNKDSSKQLVFTHAVILAEMLLLIFVTTLNPAFANQSGPSAHHAQYQQLADSLLDGKLYLEKTPPDYLAEMENPYDMAEREKIEAQEGEYYYWDAAYFEGRYYVYFGVIPVLLVYLPFRALTGSHIPNFIVVAIFLCLFTYGAFLLISKIIKKYFSHARVPYAAYLLLSLIFVNASGAVFIAKRPDFYSIPIISALAFTVFGLYFWITSLKDDGSVSVPYAALGSLCMALVAGCRPQLLLASAFIFVIYWSAVFKHRTVFSKKGAGATLALILPYVAVAAFVMWYNYARFGSPFDFGAYYNLTTNDMTGRGFRPERLGLSFFTYFLQPPEISAAFPFLNSTALDTSYLGTTISEAMFGGIFATIPVLWLLFTAPSRAKQMKKTPVLAFAAMGVCLAVVIALFDAQGAGILQRYVSDFAFLAIMSALFVAFFRYSEQTEASARGLNSFVTFSFFASAAYCAMLVFAVYGSEMYYRAPEVFSKVSEAVQFWA